MFFSFSLRVGCIFRFADFCRILHRPWQPFAAATFHRNGDFLYGIRRVGTFQRRRQIGKPHFPQRQHLAAEPPHRLVITVQAIAAKHLFHTDVQPPQGCKLCLDGFFFRVCHLLFLPCNRMLLVVFPIYYIASRRPRKAEEM